MIYLIALLAAVLVGFWILHPVYIRWRDYLQHAPELQVAPFGTKVLVLFKGLRTKMLSRLLDGLGVAVPAINAIGEWLGGGGIDLNGILPAIPLPWADGAILSPAQYSPLIFLGLGRLTDYLRNHTTTAPGTIDPALAVKVAGESNNVDGSTPTPALAAIVDPATSPAVAVPAVPARRRARQQRAPAKRKAAKRKPAKKRAVR
jgi:hypothetical protein